MKNKKYIVKGTPIVPSLCGILMAVLWYLFFYFTDGQWTMEMNTFSFEGMTGTDIYLMIMTLVVPVLFFIGVLFLAEIDLRWMIPAMLPPIVYQVSMFILYIKEGYPDYVFENPVKFIAPFLALILFVLTVEKIIPTKWVFVGFCGVAVLLPLILTLCGIGEFTFSQDGYDANYNVINVVSYLWSEYLSYALYYVGLAALTLQMRPPRESDLVTLKDMKQAYEEKMAAQNAPRAEEDSDTEPVDGDMTENDTPVAE